MTFLYLGLRMFRRNLALNVIVILQIIVALLLTNLLVGQYNLASDTLRQTAGFDADATYYYMPDATMDTTGERIEAAAALLAQHEGEYLAEQAVQVFLESTEGKDPMTYAYGPETIAHLDATLGAGTWLDEAQTAAGRIPCVTVGPYRVGEVLTFTLTDGKPLALDENGEPIARPGVQLEFEVVGTLQDTAYILTMNGMSNDPRLDEILELSIYEEEGTPILLCRQADLAQYRQQVDFSFDPADNALMYFPEGRTAASEALVASLSEHTWVTPLSEARARTQEERSKTIQTLLPVILALLFIGLVALVCLTLLNTMRSLRTYALYYICGMRWGDHRKICLGYVVCLLLGAAVLIGPVMYLLGEMLSLGELIFGWNNLAFSAGIVALAALVPLVGPALLMRRETPLDYLNESW